MADSDTHWYAVTTKSRHEKVVAEQLWQKGIECFLPLREVLSKWKDRYKKVQFPCSRVIFSFTLRYRSGDWTF